jgi:hypothetical protein
MHDPPLSASLLEYGRTQSTTIHVTRLSVVNDIG